MSEQTPDGLQPLLHRQSVPSTPEQELYQKFAELGMRAFLALGLPRTTPLNEATSALYDALDATPPKETSDE